MNKHVLLNPKQQAFLADKQHLIPQANVTIKGIDLVIVMDTDTDTSGHRYGPYILFTDGSMQLLQDWLLLNCTSIEQHISNLDPDGVWTYAHGQWTTWTHELRTVADSSGCFHLPVVHTMIDLGQLRHNTHQNRYELSVSGINYVIYE